MADAKPKMKTYTVLKNLRHDGKGFKPGSTVDLSDKHAEPLLTSKVVELAKPAESAK